MTRRYVNICEELVVVVVVAVGVVGVVVVVAVVVVAVFCSTRGNIIMVPKCRKVG
jgi:hypothetical protein